MEERTLFFKVFSNSKSAGSNTLSEAPIIAYSLLSVSRDPESNARAATPALAASYLGAPSRLSATGAT